MIFPCIIVFGTNLYPDSIFLLAEVMLAVGDGQVQTDLSYQCPQGPLGVMFFLLIWTGAFYGSDYQKKGGGLLKRHSIL